MKKSLMTGLLGMALAMEGLGQGMKFDDAPSSRPYRSLKGQPKTPLTNAQLKRRAKEKRAKKARKINF